MTAREYLTQARMIDSRINSKLMELQRARELATKAKHLVRHTVSSSLSIQKLSS